MVLAHATHHRACADTKEMPFIPDEANIWKDISGHTSDQMRTGRAGCVPPPILAWGDAPAYHRGAVNKPSSALSGFRASTIMLRPMLRGLRKRGVDVSAIAKSAGLSLDVLEDPDARVPFELAVLVSAEGARALRDPAFGLHLAEMYEPGVYGVLDYLAHSSRTLGEAIGRLCRYNRLLQDAVETLLEVEGDRAVVSQQVLGKVWIPSSIIEHALANLVVIGRHLAGAKLVPLEVEFRHAPPLYVEELKRLFNSEVRFHSTRDAVVLPVELLELPLPHADPVLCSILDRHAHRELEALPRVSRFSERVRELVSAELPDGGVSAERVAEKLRMSERTLRRRLKEEDVTFEQLLEELRRVLSDQYLSSPTVSIEEVAFMLGYSDVSAFRRAFRRWHGVSPASYRATRRSVG
jgi:AraC-like DNA-binding protein